MNKRDNTVSKIQEIICCLQDFYFKEPDKFKPIITRLEELEQYVYNSNPIVLVDKEVKEEWLDLMKAQYEEYLHFTLKEGVKEKELNFIKAVENLPSEEN